MYLTTHPPISGGIALRAVESAMIQSRAAKLSQLKFQIRSLKQRENALIFLGKKKCQTLTAETEKDLVRVRRNIEEAEANLDALLRGEEMPPVRNSRKVSPSSSNSRV